jgi:hypothetical protein
LPQAKRQICPSVTPSQLLYSRKRRMTTHWGEKRPINCFGCGRPYPWLEYIKGKYVMTCPNKLNPGVADNATKALERYCANCKKQQTNNSEKRNLASAKFSDFDEASQQRIWKQVLQANTNCETVDTVSVASSVSSPSVHPKNCDPRGKCGMDYIFIVDVQVFAAGKPYQASYAV